MDQMFLGLITMLILLILILRLAVSMFKLVFSITYPATEDSEERVDYQHESYYVVDGKIITLNQYSIRNAQQD